MYLRYRLDENDKRVYTFKVRKKPNSTKHPLFAQFHDEEENPTMSAHPARFSPDDPW